jgi:RimJ/RimL family protein N-acetyltransferase
MPMTASAQPPLGERVEWTPAKRPARTELRGSRILLRPVDAALDAEPLYALSHLPSGDPAIWTYLPDGPYESAAHLAETLTWAQGSEDPLYFTLVGDGRPLGWASYLRIAPEAGTIEIGHIWFGPTLRRTAAATEAIYMLARHAFGDLGYRRLEWKCDSLNAASRRAAQRFGFTFEGIFRQHQVVKGRNRDTAWYAIIDKDWPAIADGMRAWLSPANFTPAGTQIEPLADLIAHARAAAGPAAGPAARAAAGAAADPAARAPAEPAA